MMIVIVDCLFCLSNCTVIVIMITYYHLQWKLQRYQRKQFANRNMANQLCREDYIYIMATWDPTRCDFRRDLPKMDINGKQNRGNKNLTMIQQIWQKSEICSTIGRSWKFKFEKIVLKDTLMVWNKTSSWWKLQQNLFFMTTPKRSKSLKK